MAEGNKSMEVDSSNGSSNVQTSNGKLLVARPVSPGASGEGLPYAPEGWPSPGDVWSWRVGKRISIGNHYQDRYIYLPHRLQITQSRKTGFSSKVSLQEYIQKEFPKMNLDEFFASFIWRIPSNETTPGQDVGNGTISSKKSKSLPSNGASKSEPPTEPGECKAGNKMCSLRAKGRSFCIQAMACDICCTEKGFCRDCSCILCCQPVNWEYSGYSHIRCEAKVDENFICGHVAHLNCALLCKLCGTVEEYGLDTEYYCRRCDNRTELLFHVGKIMKACESLDAPDVIGKILTLMFRIVRGSKQEKAMEFRNCIAIIMDKINRGVCVGDIWRKEDNTSRLSAVLSYNQRLGDILSGPTVSGTGDSTRNEFTASDYINVSVKIQDEIDDVLQELKKSQESEYSLAEKKFYAKKNLILRLYQQFEAERSEFLNGGGSNEKVLDNLLKKMDDINIEVTKLKKLMKIGKGFGAASQELSREFCVLSADNELT